MNKKKWEIKKLGEVCDFINGFAFKSELFKNTGFPIVRISNIQEEKIDLDEIVCFDKNDYRVNLEKYKVQHKDILIAMSGATTGKVGIYLGTNEIYLNQRVGALRTKKNVNNQFVFYFLKTKVEETLRLALGVAQPNIGSEQIKSYEIPIPPLPIQQSIVSELDTLHRLKELQEQQLAELDNLAQSTFYHLFGDPIENEKGWEVKKLGEVSTRIGDGLHGTPTFDTDGTHWFINGNNLVEGKITINSNTKKVDYCEYEKYRSDLNNNCILISINGTVGNLAFYNNEPIMLGKSACYINLKEDINKVFIFHILKSPYFFNYVADEATGTTIRNVSLKSMRNFPLPIPPLSLQTQFSERIEKIETQKELIKQSIGETQLLIDYTMDKYFG